MYDGKNWYTSTRELQLASLDLCIACRNYPTVRLNVEAHTPRRLLAATDAPPPNPKRLFKTRVPRLRACRVTWNMVTAAELRFPMFVMTDVDCLKFGKDFQGGLEDVAWPERLKAIEFGALGAGSVFNKPIAQVQWPASLRRLEFGFSFNQPIERAEFPASLKQLVLGVHFNQPIEGIDWPLSLQKLEFGCRFNQPVEGAKFPSSLQELIFGGVSSFNQPIAGVVLPSSLQELDLGDSFNQPIEDVAWPDSLQWLAFGGDFNQPVDNVGWPASLQEVVFGLCDESGTGTTMYSEFNQRIGSSVWPASLRRLTLGGQFRQSLEGLGTWMPNLEEIRVLDWDNGLENDSLLRGIEWPNGLRDLTVFEESSLDGVVIPSTVQVYRPKNEEEMTWEQQQFGDV
ncbi:unnamed protein product [Ectocarpus sp. 4 AP-2014]